MSKKLILVWGEGVKTNEVEFDSSFIATPTQKPDTAQSLSVLHIGCYGHLAVKSSHPSIHLCLPLTPPCLNRQLLPICDCGTLFRVGQASSRRCNKGVHKTPSSFPAPPSHPVQASTKRPSFLSKAYFIAITVMLELRTIKKKKRLANLCGHWSVFYVYPHTKGNCT